MSKKRRSSPLISDLLNQVEIQAPARAAESWDNVGLIVGDPRDAIQGAVISIDLTEESLETARKLGYSVIFNHHPAIFPKQKGLSSFTATGNSKLIFDCARSGISVVACHTNFDREAISAMQDLCDGLGAKPVGRLFEKGECALLKLALYVPRSHLEAVREALFENGAGAIGDYDSCSFTVEGEGTFRGSANTNPFVGKPGVLERASEVKLETIVPEALVSRVLQAMKRAHPYEEVAYDLFRLEQKTPPRGFRAGLGYGFVAEFSKDLSFRAFQDRVRKTFDLEHFTVTGDLKRPVRRVGFVPGKGSSFVTDAARAGCDVFITGETGYHPAREVSRDYGMRVVELGHPESELYFLKTAEKWLKAAGIPVKVLRSRVQSFI